MAGTTTTTGGRRGALGLITVLAALAATLLAASPAGADHTLDLTVTTSGTGRVLSGEAPRQINCGTGGTGTIPGTDCTGTYSHERWCESEPGQEHVCWEDWPRASLTATPAPGHRFVGWSGACAGTGTCSLELTEDQSVHAEFANDPPSITIGSPAVDAWLRHEFTPSATVTDDSGLVGPVRFELWQRDSNGVYRQSQPTADDYDPSAGSRYETTSPLFLSGLYPDHAQGARLRVTACDAAGACTVATRISGVDRVQPTFTELSAPPATVAAGTHVWSFAAGDTTSGFQANSPWCSEPGFAGEACATDTAGDYQFRATYTTSGTRTWRVSIYDNAGNPRIVTRTITVDADPPDTAIDTGPVDGSSSTSTTATFNFSSEANALFRCRIYSVTTAPAVFGDCSGPGASHTTSGLPPGTYRFEVAARDGVGNTDPTPAARTFTVTAPATPGSGGDSGSTGGTTGGTDTGTAVGTSVGTTATQPANTVAQLPAQQNATPPPAAKPGKCAKLKGKKRAACIRKQCGKLNKKKTIKKYRACVKKVTRKR